MINQSDHFNILNIPKKSLGVGERTVEYFGVIFYNKFIAGCKLNKLYDFKQYLHKNLGIMHDLFLQTFSKFDNKFYFNVKKQLVSI